MSQKQDLVKKMDNELLIGDGAYSTMFYQYGLSVGSCVEELCLTNPTLVKQVHKAYYEAGARVITTNTFRANEYFLKQYGLAHRLQEINKTAVHIARESVGEDSYIMGSIGPLVAGRAPGMGAELTGFYTQLDALISSGIDGVVLETFLDLEELLAALEQVKDMCELPVIAHLALPEAGMTRDGYPLDRAINLLVNNGAPIVGLNCRLGPAEMIRSFDMINITESVKLSAYPNAGRLELLEGEYAYKSSASYFAESALQLRNQGVRLFGGCCGTTPNHIKAMAEALEGLVPIERINKKLQSVEVQRSQIRLIETFVDNTDRDKTANLSMNKNLLDRVQERETIIVELDPPRDLDLDGFLNGARALEEAGIDAITIADNSLAMVRTSNLALGALIKHQLKVEPLIHVACRDRNLIGQQSHLMGLHALGIHNILVVTGDPSRVGDMPDASSVFDMTSFDLIKMANQLKMGISFTGRNLNARVPFVVGAAYNPHSRNLEKSVQRLEKKIKTGADYIMTQPLYSIEDVHRLYKSTSHLRVPIFVGIMPLTGFKNAKFLHNEVPGISIPANLLERMEGYEGVTGRQQGINIAKELIDEVLNYFKGVYLMTPFNYHTMTVELANYIRR